MCYYYSVFNGNVTTEIKCICPWTLFHCVRSKCPRYNLNQSKTNKQGLIRYHRHVYFTKIISTYKILDIGRLKIRIKIMKTNLEKK